MGLATDRLRRGWISSLVRSERRRTIGIIVLMAIVTMAVAAAAILVPYQVALETQKEELLDFVADEIDEIEAVHAETRSGATTLRMVRRMSGDTQDHPGRVEVTIGRLLSGDRTEMILRPRLGEAGNEPVVIRDATLGVPMRRAVHGETGIVEGLDHMGEPVLAATGFIPELGWGIVAKIDVRDVRAPFVRAAFTAVVMTLLLVTILSVLYARGLEPIVRRLGVSEARYRALFEHSADGLFMTTPEGVFLHGNSAMLRMLERTPEEVEGRHVSELVAPEDLAVRPLRLLDLGRDEVLNIERTFVRPDGERICTEIHACRLPDGELLASVRDIRERKETEEAIRRRDAILEAVSFAAIAFLGRRSFDEAIQRSLARIGSSIRVSRAYVFEAHEAEDGTPLATQRYEWVADGVTAELENPAMRNMSWAETGLDRWRRTFEAGEAITSLVRDLPQNERPMLEEQGIRSIAVIPIFVFGVWWGVIGFDDCSEEHEWTGPEMDAHRALAGTIGAALERHQMRHGREVAEDAIKESERFARSTLDALNEHIAVLDEKGTIIAVNRAWREFAADNGVSAGTVEEGSNYLAVCDAARGEDESLARRFASELREVIRGNREYFDLEYPCHSPTEERWFVVRVTRFSVDGPVRVVVSHENVTERRRAEHLNRLLAAAIEQVGEAIVITDVDGIIQYVNPAFEQTSQFTIAEAIGQTPRILKSGLNDPEVYRDLWTTILEGDSWKGRLVNRRRDGSFFEEDVTISPVRDETGAIIRFIAVKRDVTEQVETERMLQQSSKMEALGRLAGGVAHDFNNLLTVIQGNLELFEADVKHPEEYLGDVRSAARQAAELTRQLLVFGRKSEGSPGSVSIAEVLSERRTMLRRVLGEHIQLQIQVAPGIGNIRIDPSQLDQILMNLVVNAADAMPEGGLLTIEADSETITTESDYLQFGVRPGEFVRLTVRDTGSGMDAAVMARIFEPFFTTKAPGKGTGLGLATVYGAVKRCGGLVQVSSEPGKGTAFEVFFPVVTAPGVRGDRPAIRENVTGTESILLVEDEPAVRSIMAKILRGAGYRVTTADDGLGALELIGMKDLDLDLVITDAMMPVLGGAELIRRTRLARPGLRFICVSGYTEVRTGHEIPSEVPRLTKPFSKSALLSIVREVLDSQ